MKRFFFFLFYVVWAGCGLAAETPVDWKALNSEAGRILKLSDCSVRMLALPEVTTNHAGVRKSVEIPIELDGTVETLCLQPHSLRSPDFKLFVQRGKALVQEAPPPPATWRGNVRGKPGSTVAAAIHDGEMQAVVNMPGKPSWIVESLGRAMPDAPKGAHAIHRSDASLPVAGKCGVVAPVLKEAASQAGATAAAPQGAPAGAMPVNFAYAEIAFDADVEYYFGTVAGTMAHIESLINAVDAIYARDVQIG